MMYTDLFRALLHGKNRHGHPILNALLYLFCPAAAYWWLKGAKVVIPDDITWQAITDFARGESIKDILQEYGVDEQTDEKLKQYYRLVKEWRKNRLDLAPELSPMFPMKAHFTPNAFGSADIYHKFGGQWRYLFEYVRVWAILMYEWQDTIVPSTVDGSGEVDFSLMDVALSAPGVRRPAYFPVWGWVENAGSSRRTHLGLLTNFPGVSKHPQVIRNKIQGIQDQLRFALVQRSMLVNGEPWSSPPNVYALDRATGESTPFDMAVNTSDALKMVLGLSEAARNGPYYPLGALQAPEKCDVCCFRKECYQSGNTLSNFALDKLFEKKKGFPSVDEDD